jgi:hypothetical protein
VKVSVDALPLALFRSERLDPSHLCVSLHTLKFSQKAEIYAHFLVDLIAAPGYSSANYLCPAGGARREVVRLSKEKERTDL